MVKRYVDRTSEHTNAEPKDDWTLFTVCGTNTKPRNMPETVFFDEGHINANRSQIAFGVDGPREIDSTRFN
jgi:hypothetical protein